MHLDALDRFLRHERAAHLLPAVRTLVEIGALPPGDGAVGVVDVEIDAVIGNGDIPSAAFAAVDDRHRIGIAVDELLPQTGLDRTGIRR